GSVKLSFTVDGAVQGYDGLENTSELEIDTYNSGMENTNIEERTYGSEQSLYHVVADMAIGTGDPGSPGTRIGGRLRVGYDQMQIGYARVNRTTATGYPDLTDLEYYYGYESETGEYENTSAEVQFGLFRDAWFFSQIVLGAGGGRQELAVSDDDKSIRDEDYDGNGTGIGGDSTPSYIVDDDEFDAYRSYDGFYLFCWFGLKWSDRVRSTHRVIWGQSNGTGNGTFQRDYSSTELSTNGQYTAVTYDLDGNTSRFETDNSIGYVNAIGDDLEVALGVRAQIIYEDFEEDGDGTGYLTIADGAASNTFETPYLQRATHKREYWLLSLPVGVEWSFHRHLAWRFGAQVRATRLDNGGEIHRDIGLLDDLDLGDSVPYPDINQRISYETSLYLNMGFGFTFWDKLSIDLLSAAAVESFNAASVVSAQVKYYF
ncbi:MAG: hypothetical protein PVF33_06935, partial [Candidatus Latescibacterota bacterium]